MNYEEKINAKKAHYEELADKAEQTSGAYRQQSSELLAPIPFGQPILVGHHSEKHHRKTLERANSQVQKSIEQSKKAAYYRQKAASVGSGGINSDDENAIQKLTDKLNKLQSRQDEMKLTNKQYKKGGWDAVTTFTPATVKVFKETMEQCPYIDKPFESFQLTNNNAKIKATKIRLEELKAMQAIDEVQEEYEAFTYLVDDNRIQFIFEGKPEDEVRDVLRQNAFKWSPSRGAWVRKLTNNALYSAKMVKQALLTQ